MGCNWGQVLYYYILYSIPLPVVVTITCYQLRATPHYVIIQDLTPSRPSRTLTIYYLRQLYVFLMQPQHFDKGVNKAFIEFSVGFFLDYLDCI
jgi:hypothetical protein